MSIFKRLKYYYSLPSQIRLLQQKVTDLEARAACIDEILLSKEHKYLSTLSERSIRQELEKWFYIKTGSSLDLDCPVTYDEKIQWLKLYDSTPIKTKLADKYLVRDWVKEKIGEKYLIDLIGVWTDFDSIDFDSLPDQFVLKATHGSGFNCIVRNKSQLDLCDIRRRFDKWLNTNYAYVNGFELQYRSISPLIIAEQYLHSPNDDLTDYKVSCFNGTPFFIQVINNRKTGNINQTIYDFQWNKTKYNFGYPPVNEEIPKPDNLDEIYQTAEILAKDFCFVRVDFYILDDGKIKFGEMTFTPNSGIHRWPNPSDNITLGNLIELPKDKYYLPGIEYNYSR